MATVPQLRSRLLEGFSEKQADLLAHVVIEAHDELVNRADFHALTCVVKELADAQKRTESRVEELAEAQRRTESRVEQLTEAQKRTEAHVGDLAEAQTRTESSVDELARLQRAMLIRLDKVDGRSLEIDVARRLPSMVGVVFRRCRVIELSELVESIEDRLSEAERLDLLQTDIVAKARRDGQEMHLVVEVSSTADSDDVARALRRAAVLVKAGLPALGIVACEAASDKTIEFASRDGVRILVAGKLMPEAASID